MRYILILFFLLSCKKNEKEDSTLVLGDKITVDFGDTPLLQENSSWGFNKSSFYYTIDHNDSLGLYIYNMIDEFWISKFFLYEGPNGLRKFDDFVLINDTLAFHSLSGFFGFQLVHLQSKEIQEFTFREIMINPGKVNFKSIYFDSEIIGFPIVEYKRTDDPDYTKESNIYGFFSLAEKQFQDFISFPEEFHNKTYSSNFLKNDFVVRGDSILANFQKSHYLYGYGLKGDKIFQIPVIVKNVNNTNPGRKSDQMDNMILAEFTGKYSSLISVGNYFYRIATTYPKTSIPSSSDFRAIVEAVKYCEMCVLKLDNNFNVLSQGIFPCVPGENGVGDGKYLVKNDRLYLWNLNKGPEESLEYFQEVILLENPH
jgi:hypothetical protein